MTYAFPLSYRWILLWLAVVFAAGNVNAASTISDSRTHTAGGVRFQLYLSISNLRYDAGLARWKCDVSRRSSYLSGTATTGTSFQLTAAYIGSTFPPPHAANFVVGEVPVTNGGSSGTGTYVFPHTTITPAMAEAGLSIQFYSATNGVSIYKTLHGSVNGLSVVATGQKKSNPIDLVNPFDKPLIIEYVDSVTGEVIYTETLDAGEQLVHVVTSPTGNPVTERYTLPEGGTLATSTPEGTSEYRLFAPGYSYTKPINTEITFSTDVPVWQPSTKSPVDLPKVDSTVTTTPPDASTSPQANPVKGDASNVIYSVPSTSPTQGLTDQTYREGTGAIVKSLNDLNKSIKNIPGGGGGSGGETEDAGTHTRLDLLNVKAESIKENAQKLVDVFDPDAGSVGKHLKSIEEAKGANPSFSDMSAAGASAGSAESGMITQFSAPSVGSTGAAPDFTIAMPAAFGGKSFNLNPFSSDRFAAICAWHRKACEWLAVVLFGLWCAKEAGAMIRGVNTANQAKGNAVVAGTGGQATALIAAGAITAVVAVALVAIMTFATTNVGGGTLLSLIDDDPFSGLVGGAVWMMDRLFPLGAIVACFAGRLVWQAAAQSAYVSAAAVIRFIVP